MEARVDEGVGLEASFLTTLARLRVLLEMPPAPGNAAARGDRQKVVQAEYDARWRAALARRPATAATLGAELARFQANASPELQQQIADDLEQHPAEAAAGFIALPADTQWVLLQSLTAWTYLNRPWILPALRQTYAQWSGNPSGSMPAADVILTHLYELAPEEGRRLILEEIRGGERRIGYDALAILPDAALPEMDAALETRYSSRRATDLATSLRDRGTTAWLMARYGSPNLLPFVTGLLARGAPSCVVDGALIVYQLKHDPATAMKRLEPNLDRASRGGCAGPLSALAAHYWDDRVESAAIWALKDADMRGVIDAVNALGSHGSSAAMQPLLDRLATWSAEWQGRATELDLTGRGPTFPSPAPIENSIVHALFQNARFLLTANDVANIRALCVTDPCRTNVDGLARERWGSR
jgi:hypothetical protein